MKITKRQLKRIIKEEKQNILRENRQIVEDYLFRLPKVELIQIVAEFLGDDPQFIRYDSAVELVYGLSDQEISWFSNRIGV